MGKIVVTEFTSLDGIVEAPGGGNGYKHAGWTSGISTGDEGTKFKYDELMEAEAQLLGRVTYEGFAAAWPGMIEATGDFGQKMNDMPKYVVSSTLDTAEWNNSTVLKGDVVEEVRNLKDNVDGVILVAGSSQLVHTLIEHDLVDELRLMVHPVVLGSGRRLFGETDDLKRLQLVDSQVMGEVVVLTYRAD
ncbi:MAG TPA: dihydrofolate reductase family protein [Solirubrobacteraceae bacterium]|jgi:dihydrofolate reductase